MIRVPLLDSETQWAALQPQWSRAIAEVLEGRNFCAGAKVAELEAAMARYTGCAHAVGVASGTDALLISLLAEQIGHQDEVITSCYSSFATAASIARVGAKPIFVDIDPVTFNLDPEQIESKITPRTKAIVAAHLFGQVAAMDVIMRIAADHHLSVIEDAAQALGAEHHRRQAGSMGHYGCFSFLPFQNFGSAGDCGMVVVQDEHRAETLRQLRNRGSDPEHARQIVGGNFHLDELQAAITLATLPYLDRWAATRRRHAQRYQQLFEKAGLCIGRDSADTWNTFAQTTAAKSNPDLFLPEVSARHVFNRYVIRVASRDQLKACLRQKGVHTETDYPLPLHLRECFASLGHVNGAFPEGERAARETLALPMYPELADEQASYVVESVQGCLKSLSQAKNRINCQTKTWPSTAGERTVFQSSRPRRYRRGSAR